jgi:hypothetical protein
MVVLDSYVVLVDQGELFYDDLTIIGETNVPNAWPMKF